MACPFFMPRERLEEGAWTHAPRLPLGDPYRGTCHARPTDVFEPAETEQRELCNCGYARGRCSHFPDDSAADAVRFSITADQDGVVRLIYILEKNYSPDEYGALEYAIAAGCLIGGDIDELLASQARAFLQSYSRQRNVKPCTCT